MGTAPPTWRHAPRGVSRSNRRSVPLVESHAGVTTSTICVEPSSGEDGARRHAGLRRLREVCAAGAREHPASATEASRARRARVPIGMSGLYTIFQRD